MAFRAGVLAPQTPHETPYFIQRTAVDGPTVMIVGGVHGNEPAGAIAADQIRQWTITRGTLVVVPRANPPALAAGTRRTPGKPRDLADLNRNFPAADDENDSPRGEIAASLWSFVVETQPDWLLDLHEGFAIHRINPESVGSSIIHPGDPESNAVVERMLESVNVEISDPTRHFVSLGRRGPINTSLARATGAHLGAQAMTLETTWSDQPISVRARQHRRMVHRVLRDLDMIEHGADAMPTASLGRPLVTSAASHDGDLASKADARTASAIRAAIFEGEGAYADGVARVAQIVAAMPDALLTHLCAADIRDGALARFDVVIFTGGRGGAQGDDLGATGRTAVRRFVTDGGGYVGICAGAYLGTSRGRSYLRLVGAEHRSPWQTGVGRVDIELTRQGIEVLDALPEQSVVSVQFSHGPILDRVRSDLQPGSQTGAQMGSPMGSRRENGHGEPARQSTFDVLARYVTAVEHAGREQRFMIGTPAIVSAPFGQGRVILIAPHPEVDPENAWIVEGALRWASDTLSPRFAGLQRTGPEARATIPSTVAARPIVTVE